MFGLKKLEVKDSLIEIESLVDAIAEGNLANNVSARTASETLQVIDRMQKKLARIFSDVLINTKDLNAASGELETLAGQMRNSSVSMFDRAKEVNTRAQQMDTNMNSVSSAAEALSMNMSEVARRAKESSENLNSVSQATEEMTSTISEIAQNSETARGIAEKAASSVVSASQKVTNLGQAAEEINKVISVITEISEQTKLLALNATIEAARAGEAGKGFAVVANEVKELAKQTSNATGDISDKVEAIQAATRSTITEIDNIQNVINEVNSIVTSIAAAVEEQSVTSKDIAQNISMAAEGIIDVTSSVDEATSSVQEVTAKITDSAVLANEIQSSIATVTDESGNIKNGATKVYASGMEVASLGADLEKIFRSFKLPPAIVKDGKSDRKLVKYTDVYSVGIESINGQHQKIMEYINQVHAAVREGSSMEKIKAILSGMAAFVVDHFATEEAYFEKYHYPEYSSHKKIHQDLLAKVQGIIDKIEAGEDVNLIEVLVFLKNWLQEHILVVDKKYGTFLSEKGVL